jgi:hypothetical protein
MMIPSSNIKAFTTFCSTGVIKRFICRMALSGTNFGKVQETLALKIFLG